ncbi:MAG: Chromosomal replication initiator protein DnaA [Candidatus Roizmanbacteria bacterium GW2011_GWA2_37_7]|uniref:Chromosomal replication initiator protein DnaA n=1 Tax=Candidatus Roizmanbacteria bacterium GW2011_GWA2_37_7 TaxID=1618481 RepID=A0A0G0H6L7_9BACT|nr:MAG: Chromosomal replication initiator protein DnaA [Candidatus Roizmanbacteria bacterium GW2011_GWA2_37_7]
MLICLLFVDNLSTTYSFFHFWLMLKSFWDEFLAAIKDKKRKNPIYYSILKDALPIKIKDDVVILSCASMGAKKYLEKKKQDIERSLTLYAQKKTRVEFLMRADQGASESPLLSFQPSKEDVFRRAGLRANFTFENFAVSPTNQVAFAAAQAVGKTPGSSYNPLFFYGGVGFGKTHLAQAIAHVVLEEDATSDVLFCSSETFMNELIESIRGKTTPRFRKKYRSLRLIVIDDIQFIAGKQTVQEEFFHTFNSVVSAGGQVVLTSDRPPQEIQKLEDRLRSRFSGGLIVDIQQPDFELRTAILLIKAREKNIEIDIEAAKIIAETVIDTRSLEGTLLSLYARGVANGQAVSLELIEDFFHDKAKSRKQKLAPQDIIKAVCSFYDVTQSQLKGASRKSAIALARQVAMFLLRSELRLNLEEVAFLVKRKDHTTVIHAMNKVRNLNMRDGSFREELSSITRSLFVST